MSNVYNVYYYLYLLRPSEEDAAVDSYIFFITSSFCSLISLFLINFMETLFIISHLPMTISNTLNINMTYSLPKAPKMNVVVLFITLSNDQPTTDTIF